MKHRIALVAALLLAGCATITTKDGTLVTAYLNSAACVCEAETPSPQAQEKRMMAETVPVPTPATAPAKPGCSCTTGPNDVMSSIVSFLLSGLAVGVAA